MNPYEQAIRHYGAEKQLEKTIEELKELITEVESLLINIRLKRTTLNLPLLRKEMQERRAIIKRIFEERGDVENMLKALDKLFNFTEADVKAEMYRKMERTMQRIEQEKEQIKALVRGGLQMSVEVEE